MPSYSDADSQSCVWLLRMERLLSASCMGWCLQDSFKEHPKSMTIACAGGASGIYLTNFFLSRLECQPANRRLLRAGGLISVASATWCLNLVFEEHPKAAIKGWLAGALSICLTKSAIFGDESESLEETPKKSRTTTTRVFDTSDMFYRTPPKAPLTDVIRPTEPVDIYDSYEALPIQLRKHVEHIGKKLNEIAKDFEGRIFETEI